MTKKYLLASMVSVLIMMIGVSVAYFSARVVGEGTNMTLNARDLKIIFTDSPALTVNNIGIGWNTTKTFTVQNQSDGSYTYDIVIKDLINTTVTYGSLQYKIESTNSGYSCGWTDVPKSIYFNKLASNVTIESGVTQSYTLYLRYIDNGEDQSVDMGKAFSGRLAITKYTPTLVDKILENNPTRFTRSSFDSSLSYIYNRKLFTTTNTEDGSLVYYFAGNALNNWIKFGKCTSADYNCTVGEDLYWRIIRTNENVEDGGVRLLYAGSGSTSAQNAYIHAETSFSGIENTSDDPMYVGYMWGSTGSITNNRTNQTVHANTPASKINSWYTATFNNSSDNNSKDNVGNLLNNYVSKTAIYCNDRSIASGTYNSQLIYGSGERIYFGVLNDDLIINPSLACGANINGYGSYFDGTSSIADKFTGSTTNADGITIGNGLLGNTPAALITADEIAFAGGLFETETEAWFSLNFPNDYITDNINWWTMSPGLYEGISYEIFVTQRGQLNFYYTGALYGIRPVISLKADVLWKSGDGSPVYPFEVALPE